MLVRLSDDCAVPLDKLKGDLISVKACKAHNRYCDPFVRIHFVSGIETLAVPQDSTLEEWFDRVVEIINELLDGKLDKSPIYVAQ